MYVIIIFIPKANFCLVGPNYTGIVLLMKYNRLLAWKIIHPFFFTNLRVSCSFIADKNVHVCWLKNKLFRSHIIQNWLLIFAVMAYLP